MNTQDSTTPVPPSAPLAQPADKAARQCECGTPFTPRRVDQVHCSTACRRAAWRRLHPTFDEMVEMPEAELRAVLDRLADARGGSVLEHLPATMPSFAAVALSQVARTDDVDFRLAMRSLAEARFPGRRGRLRVRFGGAGDSPMTDGVC